MKLPLGGILYFATSAAQVLYIQQTWSNKSKMLTALNMTLMRAYCT